MTASSVPNLTLVIELPLPPSELNPNGSRGHWSKRSKAAAAYRSECRVTMYVKNRRDWNAVPFYFARLSLRFVWCTGRRAWDADNALAAAKPAVDALRDMGVLRDDAAKRVTYGSIASVKCPRGCRCGGRIEVTVEEMAG